MSRTSPGLIGALLGRLAPRLRFPQLFAFTATLFFVDLLIPDLLPFVDEVMLGLATALLGMMREREATVEKPPMKDITPRD